MKRGRFRVVGLALALLCTSLTAGVVSRPQPAAAVASPPTQWIAQQYTELLGRAPSPLEWKFWIDTYQQQSDCTAANLLVVTQQLTGAAEFTSMYPTAGPTGKATRLATVVRAVTAHDPNDNDWDYHFKPYLSSTSPSAWATAVNRVGAVALTSAAVNNICNATTTRRGVTYFRPLDLRAKVMTDFPVNPPLAASRTQAQIQTALDLAASGTTVAERTVTLNLGEVVRVGGSVNNNQGLVIPAGVTLTSAGLPAYVEPPTGTAPTALPYYRMGRIVPNTSAGSNSTLADGLICAGYVCTSSAIVRLLPGAHLQGVWADGQGTTDGNAKVALVETRGSGAQTTATVYDDNTTVIASRLSEPGRDGAALRMRGNSTHKSCTNTRAAGNLVTAYSSISQFDQSGQAQWADGIMVGCEHATVSSNSIVDVTDAAILVLGAFNRGANRTEIQRSVVRNNAILSAGNDAHIALGADAVGECRADRNGEPIPCLDQFVPRDMTGTTIEDNTFWTGSRTSIDVGLMVGGGALWGDHQIANASPETGSGAMRGATFRRNTTGINGARLNIGIDIHDMTYATVRSNTLNNTTLVDGNPRLTWNRCPRTNVTIGTREKATMVDTDLALPTASNTSRGCLIGEPPASGPERIRIKSDGSFEGTNTKRPFVVWGGHLWYRDIPFSALVDDLRDIKRMGASTVRVMYELEDVVTSPPGATCDGAINQTEVAKIGDLATAAAQTGLYLDFTGLGIAVHHGPVPATADDPNRFTSWYDSLGTSVANEQLRWKAQTCFWEAVASELRNQNSIVFYDLVNEPSFEAQAGKDPLSTWCFGSAPQFGEPKELLSSEYCWVQNPVKDLRGRDPKVVQQSWISALVAAIDKYDATRPIGVGIIPVLNTSNVGCANVAYNNTTLAPYVDLVLPHFYPNAANEVASARQTNECKIAGKPLVVEETYVPMAFTNNDPAQPLTQDPATQEKYMADTAAKANGYLAQFIGGTPSQKTALIAATTDATCRALTLNPAATAKTCRDIYTSWLWSDVYFLRNGYLHSPAGPGITPY